MKDVLKKLMSETEFDFVPFKEIYERLKNFKQKMKDKDIPVSLIFSKVNNFYFTGTNQMQVLAIFPDNPPLLFVKRDIERAKLESPLNIIPFKSLNFLKKFVTEPRIGIEFNYLTMSEFKKLQKVFDAEFIDITRDIALLRSVKSDYELKIMQNASNIAGATYIEALNFLKEGIREIDFGAVMFSIAQKKGHEGVLRTSSQYFEPVSWHILSGSSGCIHGQYDAPASGIGLSPSFPNSAGRKKIKKGEPVMVDFGISFMGYQVDTTRMFCIGEPNELFCSFYEKSRLIENKLLNLVREGVSCGELFNLSVEFAKNMGCYKSYLGIGDYKKKFVGHGVGLETAEVPIISMNSKDVIRESMTFAIEPKFVIENFGIVGIENTNIALKSGYKKITKFNEDIFIA